MILIFLNKLMIIKNIEIKSKIKLIKKIKRKLIQDQEKTILQMNSNNHFKIRKKC